MIRTITLKLKGPKINLKNLMVILIGTLFGIAKYSTINCLFGTITPLDVLLDKDCLPYLIGGGLETIEINKPEGIFSYFVPPEIANGKMKSTSSDSFSYGAFLNYLFSKRKMKFEGDQKSIRKFSMIENIPPFIKIFLQKALILDCTKRPMPFDLLNTLLFGIQDFFRGDDSLYFFYYTQRIQYQIRLFNMNYDKTSELISVFNSSAKKLTTKIIKLQFLLLNLNSWTMDETAKWILENFKPKNEIKYVVNTIILVSNTSCTCIDPLYKLITKLQNNKENIAKRIINKVMNPYFPISPYPQQSGSTSLIFILVVNGVVTQQYVVEKIQHYYNNSNSKLNSYFFFSWFAPFIHDNNKDLYNKLYQMVQKFSGNPYAPEAFKNFFENFENYKKNNFNFYRGILPNLKTNVPLIDEIRSDNSVLVNMRIAKSKTNEIPKTIFEPSIFSKENMTLASYAALYGSAKTFHALILTNNVFIEDKIVWKLTKYAIAGGSEPILSQVFSKIGDKTDIMTYAVLYHRYSIFESELSGKLREGKNIQMLKVHLTNAVNYNNAYVITRLLGIGLTPSQVDIFGRTPLHQAAQYGSYEALTILLFHPDCKPNAKDIWGKTALHIACERGITSIVKLLVRKGKCDVNMQTDASKTPMHIAAQNGSIDILHFLKKSGADINATTNKGKTPLHYACGVSLEATKFFLTLKNVNPRAVDNKGRTAYDFAKMCHKEDIMAYLESLKGQETCRI